MKKAGFSLVEVVISGAIVATTVGALFASASNVVKLTNLSQDRLLATQLGRLTMERLRQAHQQVAIPALCGDGKLDCSDWRGGFTNPSMRQRLDGGQSLFVRPAITPGGYTFEEVTLSPSQPCSDYVTRSALDSTQPFVPSTATQDYFCRRISLEPVSSLTAPGIALSPATNSGLAVRVQTAWLGYGRNSFRSPSAGACVPRSTEWCSEVMTLITDWRGKP